MGLDWDLARHGRPLLDWLSLIDDHLSEISAIASAVSVAGWILAGLYQIKTTYTTKEVEGFSSLFLLSWVVGDMSNVIGSFFTGQMFFQKLLSICFLTLDGALFIQWIYYTYYYYEDPLLLIAEAEIPTISRYQEPPTTENTHTSIFKESAATDRVEISEESVTGSTTSTTSTQNVDTSPVSIRQAKPVSVSDILISISAGSSVSSAAPVPTELHDKIYEKITQAAVTTMSDLSWVIGTVCGYICSALYMFSIIPQLIKNHQEKSTGTVSVYIFLADLVGNFGYSLSIISAARLIQDPVEHSEFVSNEMPFLIGTSTAFCLELIVIYQFYIYRNSYIYHHHNLHSRPSRDVMPETMALITTPESSCSNSTDTTTTKGKTVVHTTDYESI